MKAGDMMTTSVVTVKPDASAHSIALLLWKKGISAVPVVDDHGVPLGMISEGDLMPRDESEREARRDWWLKALAEGEELNPDFFAIPAVAGSLRAGNHDLADRDGRRERGRRRRRRTPVDQADKTRTGHA
jgi:hypothetical protein